MSEQPPTPTITETVPGKYIPIKEFNGNKIGPDGNIIRISGTTFDLLDTVCNFGNIPQGGFTNSEVIKRGKLWRAIEKQKPKPPEGKEDPQVGLTRTEIVAQCDKIILSEKKFNFLAKILKGMHWGMSGQHIEDFIISILGEEADDDE